MVCCVFIALVMMPFLFLGRIFGRADGRGRRAEAWHPKHSEAANRKFSLWQSFGFGFSGMRAAFVMERNLRIHSIAMVMVVAAGLYFGLRLELWLWVILAVALVVMAELLNTAVERVCDAVSLEFHPEIKLAKDIAAAGVIVSAIFAIIVAIFVVVLMMRGVAVDYCWS